MDLVKSTIASVLSTLFEKPWTPAESMQLLVAIHVDHERRWWNTLNRSYADCAGHYQDLFIFAKRGWPQPFNEIDHYYKQIPKRHLTEYDPSSERIPWTKKDTVQLFRTLDAEGTGRTKEECFDHYFEVTGFVFRGLGGSEEEGLRETVKKFYQEKATTKTCNKT